MVTPTHRPFGRIDRSAHGSPFGSSSVPSTTRSYSPTRSGMGPSRARAPSRSARPAGAAEHEDVGAGSARELGGDGAPAVAQVVARARERFERNAGRHGHEHP